MKLLNVMSYYKLNTLHMHLTDAGGWRIQMDKYPETDYGRGFPYGTDWQKWWDGRIASICRKEPGGIWRLFYERRYP